MAFKTALLLACRGMSSTSNLRFKLQLGLVGLLTAGGCASPGSPKPPSLRLPEKARALAARRTGNTVAVTWFTPANTTDGQPNRGLLTAQICFEVVPRMPADALVCKRQPVASGASAASFNLQAPLTSGAPQLVAYRVELLNDRGRSAGLGDPAYVATGPAPAPSGLLTATPERAGILLRWPAMTTSGYMQITRQTIPAAGAKVQNAVLAPKALVGLLHPRADQFDQVVDPGGVLDRAARESRLAETPPGLHRATLRGRERRRPYLDYLRRAFHACPGHLAPGLCTTSADRLDRHRLRQPGLNRSFLGRAG